MERKGNVLTWSGSEANERVAFDARMERGLGASDLVNAILQGVGRLGREYTQAWERVSKVAREQGLVHEGEELLYNWVTQTFTVHPTVGPEAQPSPAGTDLPSLKARIGWIEGEKLRAVEGKRFEDAAWLRDYAVRLGGEQMEAELKAQGEQPSVAGEPEIVGGAPDPRTVGGEKPSVLSVPSPWRVPPLASR